MTLITAKWTPQVNLLLIACDCGAWIEHRADRWRVTCRTCRSTAHLADLRDDYLARGGRKPT